MQYLKNPLSPVISPFENNQNYTNQITFIVIILNAIIKCFNTCTKAFYSEDRLRTVNKRTFTESI